MLVEPGNQFSLTRAALSTCAAPKNQILISSVLGNRASIRMAHTAADRFCGDLAHYPATFGGRDGGPNGLWILPI